MTDARWIEQPGGLLLSVQRFDRENPQHLENIVPAMQGTFAAISRKHGADFAEQGMRNNLIALLTDRTNADIYFAKWKDAAEEVCMGVAYGWKTYGFTPGGVLVDAEYTEDIALNNIRELVRAKPAGKIFPEEGLAKCLERIHLHQMRDGGAVYRFGEVSSGNTTMMRQLLDNGAKLGLGPDSALMEFKRLPNSLLSTLPMGARVRPIFNNGIRDELNFLVTCLHDDTAFRSIVRLGQATALGFPRTDLRMYQEGKAAKKSVTRCFINSTLFAMKIEAEDRGFGNKYFDQIPEHLRPLLEANPKIAEIVNPSGGELNSHRENKTFCAALPEVHIAVQSNENLVEGLRASGAERRFHGLEPMVPGTNILQSHLGLALN